jgi:hypothetical protein
MINVDKTIIGQWCHLNYNYFTYVDVDEVDSLSTLSKEHRVDSLSTLSKEDEVDSYPNPVSRP